MKNFIGVFDSGIGGLSVLESIREILPNENIVYLADEKNCPYGTKTIEEVRQITLDNINYLKAKGAKYVVVACNTATSSILDVIENEENKIIGVIEPTALYAYQLSKSKKIGLFATNLTVKTNVYNTFLKNASVFSEGCSDFVTRIEAGDFNSYELTESIKNHFEPLQGVDTLILGCTHFKFIKDSIKKIVGDINIVDSGEPTTLLLKERLLKLNLLNKNDSKGLVYYETSGDLNNCINQLKKLNIIVDNISNK